MSTLAYLGMGSNLGDRKANLDLAIAALAESRGLVVRGVSSYQATAPVGGPAGQGSFLNAAAALETTLEPLALLHRLQDLEREAGRIRTVRWGERPLDLDLLLYGNLHIDTRRASDPAEEFLADELQVPHPRMPFRRFVLSPLAELAPEAIHPITGRTVASLLANLDRRPSCLAFHDPLSEWAPEVYRRVVAGLSAVEVAQGALRSSTENDLEGFPDPREVSRGRLERRCRGLRAARRSLGRDVDRWLVSNTWFDTDPEFGEFADEDQENFLEKASGSGDSHLAPTFVALPRGLEASLRGPLTVPGRTQHASRIPILEVGGRDASEISDEILTTCLATR